MPFDKKFFDQLRSLTDSYVASIDPRPGHLRPTVNQLSSVLPLFKHSANEFVRQLSIKSGYIFQPDFRVYPRHIVNFSKGKAFRKQLNVALTAGTDSSEDCVRIGLGFSISYGLKPEGWDDYADFQRMVQKEPTHFNSTFSALGGYFEPTDLSNSAVSSSNPELSDRVIADTLVNEEEWRFFGKKLRWASDSIIISDPDLFVYEVINVFDQIVNGHYYKIINESRHSRHFCNIHLK